MIRAWKLVSKVPYQLGRGHLVYRALDQPAPSEAHAVDLVADPRDQLCKLEEGVPRRLRGLDRDRDGIACKKKRKLRRERGGSRGMVCGEYGQAGGGASLGKGM